VPSLVTRLACLAHGHDPGTERDAFGRPLACVACGVHAGDMPTRARLIFFGRALMEDAEGPWAAIWAARRDRMTEALERAAAERRAAAAVRRRVDG
jgi:hypothetical protein